MEDTVITIFAKWQVKSGKLAQVLTALEALAQKSREEEGNLSYQAHQSIGEDDCILLFETYRDQEALEAHRTSVHYQDLGLNTIVPLLAHREVSTTKEIFKSKS
ncbi:MAG: putative quinol monooxygenase [Cytophagales bacterium]|nr:putative quinol monooxygenase [Cytophagales bacterium]